MITLCHNVDGFSSFLLNSSFVILKNEINPTEKGSILL